MTALAPTLQAFFTDRLVRERHASPATVAAYRDTWRMLLDFAATRTRKSPIRLDLDDIDAPLVSAFLDHLETHRGNTARTRNARLAGIHSVFRFAAHRHPEHTATIARVLAIPTKRFDRSIITYLTPAEVAALLAAPDLSTWFGRRDQAWLQTAAQTGLRISEMTALTCADVHLGVGAHVSCLGKGRKQRITPLTVGTVTILTAWINERGNDPAGPLFPTRSGRPMSRDAVEHRIAVHTATAAAACPSLNHKTVTAHTLRHTAAMRLLEAGTDTSIISLWLGHEQVQTTTVYLHADLAIKERALARTTPPDAKPGRYQPPDPLLAFLESL
jgi:site-specific recombinase XerD